MAEEKTSKFHESDTTRRVVIGLSIGIVLIVGLIYFFKSTAGAEDVVTSANVAKAPDVASVPGTGTPSAEYVKAQELANIELAKQAARTSTESAIPTITRTVMKEVDVSDMISDGCDIESLKKAREAGVTAAELRCRGCSAAQLMAAGYTAAELRAAGFSASDLLAAGFSIADLRAAGFSATELLTAGVSVADLRAAGFSDSDINAATGADVDKNCSVEVLRKARADGVSAAELKNRGCDASALRAAGFTAAELRAAGFTAAELKAAGFSAAELRAAGFSASELRAAGFTAEELREAGFTAAELRAAGFSAGELIRAGFSSADMATACDISVLKEERESGITAEEIKARGCSLMALAAAGYTREELLDAGFDLDEIKASAPVQVADVEDLLLRQVPTVDESVTDPMERLRMEQLAQMAESERQQQIQEIESAMLTQATQLVSSWRFSTQQAYVQAEKKEGANTAVNPVDALPPSQVFQAKAGDVIYAVLNTEVNTDERSPVMASVVSGKLKGSKLIGSYVLSGESAVLNFVRISVPSVSLSSPIAAVAIDANTAKTAMSTDVDHHYLLRYGTMFASSFIKGFSDAVKTQGSQTITGDGAVVSVFDKRSNKDRLYMGLGEVGSQYGKLMAQNFQRPITVTVKKGTGFGLLFTNDTRIPLVDVERK